MGQAKKQSVDERRRSRIPKVDHRKPDYYQGPVETIDSIFANGYRDAVGFCRGNILKYTCRYQDKGGLGDLKKAMWYLDLLWAIECFVEHCPPKEIDNIWSRLPTVRQLLEKYPRP